MIHPDTELKFINDTIGYGVVAKKFIPKGTITWVLDSLDREFEPAEAEKMPEVYREILDTYCFRNNEGKLILCWDNGRFVNHSFNSNCLSTAYDFEVAIRDIQPGEQLTDDYGYLNVSEPFRAAPEGTRRKVVYPDDLPRHYKAWDKKLLPAFLKIKKVDQPLEKLLTADQKSEIDKVVSGKAEMKSILHNYYNEENKQN
ncbi:SET domain-containing protein [Halocola ammonii]